jgi:hypothetical protein
VISARVLQGKLPAQVSVGENSYVKQKLRLVLPLTAALVVIGGAVFVIWSVATTSAERRPDIATVWATVLTAIALVPPVLLSGVANPSAIRDWRCRHTKAANGGRRSPRRAGVELLG